VATGGLQQRASTRANNQLWRRLWQRAAP
jgi:hypothetical protein